MTFGPPREPETPVSPTLAEALLLGTRAITANEANGDGRLNVKWFGAVGDGNTDDTVAIVAALQKAVELKRPVYFPTTTGPYLTDPILIQDSGVWLVGDPGKGSAIKVPVAAPPYYVGFDGGENCGGGKNPGLSQCGMRDLRIEGVDGETGLWLRGVNHSEFSNLRIVNVADHGILAESCWASKYEAIKVSTFDDDVSLLPQRGIRLTWTLATPTDSGALAVDVVAAAKTYTRATGSWLADGFYAGMLVTWSGFANGGNNGDKVVADVTASVMTMVSGAGLVDETGSGDEQAVSVPSSQQCETISIIDPVVEGLVSAGSGTGVYFERAANCGVFGGLLESCDCAVITDENTQSIATYSTWCNSISIDFVINGENTHVHNTQAFTKIQFGATSRASRVVGGYLVGDLEILEGARGTVLDGLAQDVGGGFSDAGIGTIDRRWDRTTATFARTSTGPAFLPAPNEFRRLTGLAPSALFLCDETSGGLRDAVANIALTLSDPGDVTHRYFLAGLRGVHFDVNVGRFSLADAYNPGAASQMRISVFSVDAHHVGDVGIEGSTDTTGHGILTKIATADDKVHVAVTGAGSIDGVVGGAITYGDVYALCSLIDRDDDTLYLGLKNLGTGVVETSAQDISSVPDLTDGDDVFQIGWLDNIGVADGVTVFGVAIVDAGVEAGGAGLVAATLAALGTIG